MIDENYQDNAANDDIARTLFSFIAESTNPESSEIRAAIIEAASIIACAELEIATSEITGRPLHVETSCTGLDHEDLRSLFMSNAIRRASEALLSATDKQGSISGLIDYEIGPGDKAGRKQALVNVLALFQNVWLSEEPYMPVESWGHASSINFHLERLEGLLEEAQFWDTADVTLLPATDDATQANCQEADHSDRRLAEAQA